MRALSNVNSGEGAIKVLKHQGKSSKRFASETGPGNSAVKKYLQRTGAKTAYQRKIYRPSKRDPFKDYIQSRIDAVHSDGLSASVLY